jgi:hypothetical protein
VYDFLAMLQFAGVLGEVTGVSEENVKLAFLHGKMTEVDEMASGGRHMFVSMPEFIEVLGRVARDVRVLPVFAFKLELVLSAICSLVDPMSPNYLSDDALCELCVTGSSALRENSLKAVSLLDRAEASVAEVVLSDDF